jgi:choline dehydrogenase
MEYDYIIIGAGSAGNTLAARLTEDADVSVLLLEAGGPDYRLDFRTQMPAALAYPLQGTRYNWAYKTDPEPHMNNRRMDCGRGKGLGGSSLINGMCYIRGNAMDYDNWATMPGLETGPTWTACRISARPKPATSAPTTMARRRRPGQRDHAQAGNNPLFHAMVEAGVQAGYPTTEDSERLPAGRLRPDGPHRHAQRPSRQHRTRLPGPAKERSNLTIVTHALTDRVLFEGKRAVGVRYLRGRRAALNCTCAPRSAAVRRRHRLASGAAALRRRPGKLLKGLDIEVVHDLPGVGQNLQDHLEMYLQYACTQPVSLYPAR